MNGLTMAQLRAELAGFEFSEAVSGEEVALRKQQAAFAIFERIARKYGYTADEMGALQMGVLARYVMEIDARHVPDEAALEGLLKAYLDGHG